MVNKLYEVDTKKKDVNKINKELNNLDVVDLFSELLADVLSGNQTNVADKITNDLTTKQALAQFLLTYYNLNPIISIE